MGAVPVMEQPGPREHRLSAVMRRMVVTVVTMAIV